MAGLRDDRVVIVGAGPVGLCLALALAREGVASCLLESMAPENFLDQVPRAGTNHPATLEMFDAIGLYPRLEKRGLIAPFFSYWDRAAQERIAEFDHAALKQDTKFPYALQCERIKVIEEAMAMALENPLIEVRMRTEFDRFEETPEGIVAHAMGPDGPEAIGGRYIVGTEGARSVVRKQLGIEFEGFTYPDRTLNIEVAYDFTRHGYADRNYISDPEEWANLFHWKGPPERWRVHFPTDPDAEPEALMAPEALQARMQRFLPNPQPYEIIGCNLYTVHQRVAATFRLGRAVLAGDSAHVNSPIGGMGMNSGIHDAFNLADKLGRIWRGEDDSLLDLYARQRRHIAVKHTQAQTIRNKKLLEERDPAVRAANNAALRQAAEDPVLARKFLLRTSLLESVREAASIT